MSDPGMAHSTKECALANTKGEQSSFHLGSSLLRGKEGRCATAKGRRPEATAISP